MVPTGDGADCHRRRLAGLAVAVEILSGSLRAPAFRGRSGHRVRGRTGVECRVYETPRRVTVAPSAGLPACRRRRRPETWPDALIGQSDVPGGEVVDAPHRVHRLRRRCRRGCRQRATATMTLPSSSSRCAWIVVPHPGALHLVEPVERHVDPAISGRRCLSRCSMCPCGKSRRISAGDASFPCTALPPSSAILKVAKTPETRSLPVELVASCRERHRSR